MATKKTKRKALSPEIREQQITLMAYDEVEKRIKNGTATSQELTHFLKIGSQRYEYEIEKLKRENELLEAKKKSLDSSEVIKELYQNALNAFSSYSGNENEDEEYD